MMTVAVQTRAEDDDQSGSLRSGRLPWAIAGIAVAAMTAGAILDDFILKTSDGAFESLVFYLLFVSFSLFGALVVKRMPDNDLGWVFILFGTLGAVGFLGQTYAQLALVRYPGRWPLGWVGAWIEQWFWYPTLALLICFMPLLFPNGRLPSPRWRIVFWVAVVSTTVIVVGGMVERRLSGHSYSIDNPVGVAFVGDVEETFGVFALVLAACSLMAIVSLFVRYRRSPAEQRQQLKWFIFAFGVLVAGSIAGDALELPEILLPILLAFVMASMAISVLKYRLYDIDVIINRAFVYISLSAALVASYALIVVALGRVLDPVTRDSDLAVAASTLVVAALFRPLRSRIQDFIDRRFYRSRYDAARAVSAFATHLRDEVDVEAVRDDLVAVVARTLQPRHASVWLHEGGTR